MYFFVLLQYLPIHEDSTFVAVISPVSLLVTFLVRSGVKIAENANDNPRTEWNPVAVTAAIICEKENTRINKLKY